MPPAVASAVPYEVNSPLWSDGTLKRRWMVLPGTTQAHLTMSSAWELPDGAFFIKEFAIETTRGNPATRRPIETRFLVRIGDGWYGYSYRWNDTGTEATRVVADPMGRPIVGTYSIQEMNGSTTTYSHRFPIEDCSTCHDPRVGSALGIQTAQLNRDHDYGGGRGAVNQLVALSMLGMLDGPLPMPPAMLPRIPDPADTTAPLEARARSYIHANCRHCHNPMGTLWDATYDASFAGMCMNSQFTVYDEMSQPIMPLRRIFPGDPGHSSLFLRISRRDASWPVMGMSGQMPPLATNLVDPTAVSVIGDWITHMTTCPP
jgi:hypothetical protein